jgi:hypothetical protein
MCHLQQSFNGCTGTWLRTGTAGMPLRCDVLPLLENGRRVSLEISVSERDDCIGCAPDWWPALYDALHECRRAFSGMCRRWRLYSRYTGTWLCTETAGMPSRCEILWLAEESARILLSGGSKRGNGRGRSRSGRTFMMLDAAPAFSDMCRLRQSFTW